VLRFFLLSSQYRSEINYSEEGLKEAQQKLERFYTALQSADASVDAVEGTDYAQRFEAAMDDDFNTPQAISVLFELVTAINKAEGNEKNQLAALLKKLGDVLGTLQSDPEAFFKGDVDDSEESWIQQMIAKRAEAKASKDWGIADQVRDELAAKGIVLKDSPDGTSWSKS
jgi:cysteinyl-tRNA synthetase